MSHIPQRGGEGEADITTFAQKKLFILLFLLAVFTAGKFAYADSVGQAQVTKFFAPETVQMLLNRTGSATPGIQQGDTLTYIIESIPVNDGGNQGVNGYITDYIPKGLEVVGASFVGKVPNPTLPGGFDYVDRSLNAAGLMQQGTGKRGAAFIPPFSAGGLPEGSQDTGIFYSTDPRTSRTLIGVDVTACTGAGFAAPLLVYSQWDIDQFNAFGNGGGCITLPVGPALISGGQGTHPLVTLGAQLKGLGSPVAGPETYYTNDYNPGLLLPPTCIAPVGALPAALPYACAGPWKRINYPGSMMGGQGPITAYLAGGAATAPVSTAVPTSIGEFLSSAGGNPNLPWAATIPATRVNAVRWAFGQRVVGTIERVKISFKVRDFAAFSAAPPLGAGFQNHSSVFGGDITAPAAGKDLTYKYLGPTQSISDARLMLIKQVVAVGVPSLLNPAIINWTPSDGATVSPGQFVKYRITYLNATSRSLAGFSIVDQLDILPNIISGVVNVAYVAGSATTGIPYLALPLAAAGTVSWVPALPQSTLVPGGGGYVELVVQVLPGAGLGDTTTNTAHGLSTLPLLSVFSYAPSNITTVAPARLTNSKTVSPVSAIPGQNVKYSIVVGNTGGPLVGPIFGGAAAGGPSVYPAGGDIVIGDKLDPNLLIAPNTLATPITVSLRDKNTGLIYPYPAATALPTVLVQPPIPPALVGTSVAYWTITGYPLTYPAPVPLPAAANYLSNVDFLIDFYATVQLPTAPGTYFNGLESYAADAVNGVDLNWVTSGLAPLTVSAAGSASFPNVTFKKTATDVNGPVLNPGDDILYNFAISNAVAPSPSATNVVVTDPLPPGTKFVVGSAAGLGAIVSYSNNGGLTYMYPPVGLPGVIDPYVTHVRFTYPSLATGATLNPSLKARTLSTLQDNFVVSNQATLTALSGVAPFSAFSLTSDDNPLLAPNPNPTTINISALASFTTSTKTVLGNTGGGTNVQPADILTYAITVTNMGFSASNISVVDTLNLSKLSFGAHVALPANWSVVGPDANGLIKWNVANMPAASTVTLTFTATVNALAKGEVVDNAAVISSDQSSPFTVNAPTLTVPAPRVSGVVFSDTNGNAIQDVGEAGVANVTVALRALGSTVDTVSVITNASGTYVLTAPLAGDWYAQVTDLSGVLTGFSSTTNNPLLVTLTDGVTLNNQNFGYTLATLPASVKGRIFDDIDANGIQNGAEIGYSLVTLELQAANGVVLASTVTDVLGDYVFANVAVGDYRLVVTDTSSVLFNRYLTTGLSSPVALTNLLADSISTVNFGYALGSQIGDVVFDDANNNGIQDIGETGIPGIVLTLTKGGVTVATATTDNAGVYLFAAVPPSNIANDYTLSLVVPVGFTASTALVSPVLLTVVSGVDDLTKDFGFNAPPNLLVTKTSASPTANFSSSAEYTITVTNTGGAAANFSVADILPTATPPLSVGGALPYTPSPSSFLYFSTTSVLLNGLPYSAPVLPLVQFVTQPQWSGFTMPAVSTLTVTFTAFTGALEGVHHNGVRLSYNNNAGALPPQTVLDFPNLASVTLSTTGVLSKAVTAVNGVAPVAGIEPTVTVGDTVTYTVTLSNSSAAVAQQLKSVTETMPLGFTYKLNSTVITAPLNPPVAFNPTVVGQVLTWTMPALTPPTTLALNPLSTITLSFDLLVGPAVVQGSHTDVATGGVVVGLNSVLILSTGNTAPVTVLKPSLSMSKTTSTPLVTKDALGQYIPANYTVKVLNAGLVNATAVVLTDTLPAGFTFGTGTVVINGVPVAASFTQLGQVLTITTNPAGGFTVPANNGVSDGQLIIDYTAIAAATNLPNIYTNTVALAAANANPISGVSSTVELSGIQLGKTTSTPSVLTGGFASYTITVTNHSAAPLTNTNISDILPTGFTYQLGSTQLNGVTAADPAGTLQTPQWLLATVAGNSSVTISFNADIGLTTPARVYYNTIQASNASGQTFPNPGPTAPVTVVPPTPTLMVLKSANTATVTPGSTIIYTVNVSNTGSGQANTVVITDHMSQYTKLALTPFPTGLFNFIDGVNPSGLFGTATVSFSNDGGATYNYNPVDDGTGHDPAITNFRLLMDGVMNANQAANPSFSVQYQVQVK